MILADIAKVIRDEDIPLIINASLDILEQTGVQVENDELLGIFSDNGAIIDHNIQRARFPKKMVEQALESSEKKCWHPLRPSVTASVGIY